MTVDKLKAKAERKQAELKEIQKELKEKELEEKKAEEFIRKLDEITPEISKGVQAILDKAGIKLPEGKQVIITAGEAGLLTNIVNSRPERTGRGNGGAKAITFEGQQMSWAKLCELKGIARTPSGSAHRDAYTKAREIHDSIQHECPIDGKPYPIGQG